MRARLIASVLAYSLTIASSAADTSPYRDMETRTIKALSEQEIADLAAGKGMSLALAAELNGFPGPRHVLDLAESLGLSESQIAAVQAMFDAMKAEASALGASIIAREAELEHGFRTASLDGDRLREAVMAIAELRGQLRETHLRFHLTTRDALNPHQRHEYARLRGYGSGGHKHHGSH